MKDVKWYYEPFKICFDLKEQDSDPGILSKEDLEKYHTSISSTLDHATTILEYDRISNSVQRNESGILKHKMRNSCKRLRDIFGEEVCHKCDAYHFEKYFQGRNYESLSVEGNTDGVMISAVCDENENETRKRLCGEYTCPYLGYTELIFPLFWRSKVIGVIFVGQIVSSKNRRPFMRSRSLWNSIKKNTYECFSNEKLYSLNTIKKIYRIAFNSKDKEVFNEEDLNQFKVRVKKLLDDFEDTLNTEVFETRCQQIDSIFAKNKDKVFKDILAVMDQNNTSGMLEKFWEIINGETERLFCEMEVGNVYVFGNKQYTEGISQKTLRLPFLFELSDLTRLDDFVLNGEFQKDILFPTSTYSNQSLLKYVIGNPIMNGVLDNSEILIWPAYDTSCCVIFVLQFTNPNNCSVVEDAMLRKYLVNTILDYFAILFSNYQSLWAVISKERIIVQKKINEDAFSIFSHELQQHTSTLSRLYACNLASVELINQMLIEKKVDIITEDVFSSLKMIEYLAHNTKYYLDLLTPDKEYFYAFSKKIFKFVSIFSREIQNKNLFLHTPQTLSKSDQLRSEVFCDPVLFEQIVYNLLKNALQYSHDNTIIYVDCKKESYARSSPHKLTIVNYGIKLDDKINIYGMHERGAEAKAYFEKGSGIGLFIVKKIVDAIGGKITHDGTKKISDFNIALMKPYMQIVAPTSADVVLTKQIEHQLASSAYKLNHKCINRRYKDYGEDFIKDRIRFSTWETIFTVTIPSKEESI